MFKSKINKDSDSFKLKRNINISNNMILLSVLIVIFIVFSLLDKDFLTYSNISTMFRNMVVIGVLAIGLTPLMISRGIDISFGSNLSIATVIIAIFYIRGMNIFIAMFIAILLCTLIATVNGILIELFNLNALILTLGAMAIYKSLALVISKAEPILIPSDVLFNLGYNSIFKLPIPVWGLIFFIILYYFILKYTAAGRTVYLIGAEPQAAFSCGIRVKKVRIILYAFFGMMVGFAAVFVTGFYNTGDSYHGDNLLLPVLIGILLGGIGLEGGSGNILGTVLGVVITSTIFNGLTILALPSNQITIIQGFLLLVIVAIYQVRSRRNAYG